MKAVFLLTILLSAMSYAQGKQFKAMCEFVNADNTTATFFVAFNDVSELKATSLVIKGKEMIRSVPVNVYWNHRDGYVIQLIGMPSGSDITEMLVQLDTFKIYKNGSKTPTNKGVDCNFEEIKSSSGGQSFNF
ncbi:MAG: hypothetical protein J0M15_14810 [Deltaproteobacteria bacterium]|nr:hypothetical protein [Deltaproteobacteria bacterium]